MSKYRCDIIITRTEGKIANYKYFVDKTELISDINNCIGTDSKYICITRLRRFGKKINAMILVCYYSKKSDFKSLFDKLKIRECKSYLKHLNQHIINNN